MTNIQVKMKLAKETKGTFVFHAESEQAAIPTLYIKKSAFPKQEAPSNVTITLEVE